MTTRAPLLVVGGVLIALGMLCAIVVQFVKTFLKGVLGRDTSGKEDASWYNISHV